MKAISRRSLSMNSSLLNTATYLARSSRIAAAAKKDQVQLDRTVKFRLGTDWMGRSVAWTDSEADRLQYCLAYSNADRYCSEDLLSLARGREVTAERMEEEAASLKTRAAKIAARASILIRQFHQYQSKQYWEAASLLTDEVEDLEEEAGRLFEAATDLRKQADFYYGEAKAGLEEERYVSKWEEIYDMM